MPYGQGGIRSHSPSGATHVVPQNMKEEQKAKYLYSRYASPCLLLNYAVGNDTHVCE